MKKVWWVFLLPIPIVGVPLGVAFYIIRFNPKLLAGPAPAALAPAKEVAGGLAAGMTGVIYALILMGVVLVTYFLPAFVAGLRHHRNVLGVAILNLVFGWTLIGWVAALIWAVWVDRQSEPKIQYR